VPQQSNISRFAEDLNQALSDIHAYFQVMLKNKADPFLKGKLTFPQYVALQIIAGTAKIKMKTLAKKLNVTLPAATGLIDRLVALGMVKRDFDDTDRRVVLVVITADGRKVVDNVKKTRKKIIEKMFSCLSDNERRTYLKMILKVKANVGGAKNR
jgi:DNA-binding MarR family transcriptional regulator